MDPKLIRHFQKKDKQLKKAIELDTKGYSSKAVESIRLTHYKRKIYLPKQLQARVIAWYHEYLCHPGATRLEGTIGQHFTWPKMHEQIRAYCKTCPVCQKWKRQRKKYGHLPAKEAEADPWTQVHVDMMGPLTVRDSTGKSRAFLVFTAIDPATGWFECVPVLSKDSHTVLNAFNNNWLCRYPRPRMIRFDNGTEFKSVFEEMCENYSMAKKPTTTYNPRSNGIIERIHQVLRDSVATFELSKQELPEVNPFDSFCASASWAIRSSFHSTLQATPGQLVFGRDMLLDLKFKANWADIRLRKQTMINKGVVRENKNRIPHEYTPGSKVLYTLPGILPKMDQPRTGPWEVKQVFPKSGTVSIQRKAVADRVNIRNISPFFER
jgi:transposase InsO family protein